MLDFGRSIMGPVVAWRAKRIADPIERLRFLRKHAPPVQPAVATNRRFTLWAVTGVLCLALVLGASYSVQPLPAPRVVTAAAIQAPIADVWMVESKPSFETYSNG